MAASRLTRSSIATTAAGLVLFAALAVPSLALGGSSMSPAQPSVISAADGSFDAVSDHGAVGAALGVFPFIDCPEPIGAGDWTVLVSFAQGANSRSWCRAAHGSEP